jgi:anaerobic magnesium-protoporphyrin IX monomethyl ester cyclase
MNKKVSFIVPSWHYWIDPLKHQPYWEIYYATHVRNAGYDVDIYDMRDKKYKNLKESVDKIPQRDFYFYWIFKTGDASEIYSIASLLKQKYPNSIHAAGGTHVDMCTDECKNYFDAVVVGSGEKAFSAIIGDFKKGLLKKVYNFSYKQQKFKDTDCPDRSFLPKEKVVNSKIFSQYGDIPATLTYFSRGCVFKCAYCVYNVPNYLQVKSQLLIEKEIDYLKTNYGIKGILVKDEIAIHPNKKISTSVLGCLKNADIVWRGQTISIATREQLKLAAESGCLELSVGIETVDDQVMRTIDKSWQTQKKIQEFMKNCKEFGIKIKICLILGLPGEKEDIAEKTIEFLNKIQPDFISVSGFCPLPGSTIYRQPEKYGIEYIDKNWNNHSHLLYRFSDEEEVGLPFRYAENTPWGKPLSREQIKEGIIQVQTWGRENGMLY